MKWYFIKDFYFTPLQSSIRKFLIRNEWNAMDITSVLQQNNYRAEKNRLAVHVDGADIDAVIFMTYYGKIIPVFTENFRFNAKEVAEIFGNRIYIPSSISGTPEAANSINQAFACGRKNLTINYLIMELQEKDFQKPEPAEGLTISRSTAMDLIKLYPLQKTYEQEEVLLNPAFFNQWETLYHLRDILHRQICFYGKIGGKAVSKANSSAIGFEHIQLGGVFTSRPYRDRGIAKSTVAAICNEILTVNHKNVSLFVKEQNTSAIRVYSDLGFKIKNKYKTIYMI
ncbi:MAG: GNAT family N-acetyltransferase [Spirochaetia bacterium]|nr:GNAT family N-acetyltransferase [Spirochaetia bacterium]